MSDSNPFDEHPSNEGDPELAIVHPVPAPGDLEPGLPPTKAPLADVSDPAVPEDSITTVAAPAVKAAAPKKTTPPIKETPDAPAD